MGDLVERLVRHATRQRAVADHRHHEPSDAFAKPGLGDAERVAQRRRSVAVLDEVVLGLVARRVARQSPRLAQAAELRGPSGDELVHVRLVTRVPDDRVPGAVEDAMQRKGQLDDAEVGRQVTAGARGLLDQERAHLARELCQLRLVERLEVRGRVDRLEDSHFSS